jgi:hypothetical protein
MIARTVLFLLLSAFVIFLVQRHSGSAQVGLSQNTKANQSISRLTTANSMLKPSPGIKMQTRRRTPVRKNSSVAPYTGSRISAVNPSQDLQVDNRIQAKR